MAISMVAVCRVISAPVFVSVAQVLCKASYCNVDEPPDLNRRRVNKHGSVVLLRDQFLSVNDKEK